MISSPKHFVIIVPGIGDQLPGVKPLVKFLTSHWPMYGLQPCVHIVEWCDSETLDQKLRHLTKLIDSLAKKGKVSLVGVSAGGTLVFNAYLKDKNKLHRVVSVGGRLRNGRYLIRSLHLTSLPSPMYKQAVLTFEKEQKKLSHKDRLRLMTVRPFFGDEVVPRGTADLVGADNQWQYVPEHGLCILMSLTFTKTVINFLNKK